MTIDQPVSLSTPIIPGNSLRAATPEEGLQLATQVAHATHQSLGSGHGTPATEMADYLSQSSSPQTVTPLPQLVISSFAIVAAANNYWR